MVKAWVLAPGVTLPVDHLPRLENEFTIGVNLTFLRSGFVPKVLFFYDRFSEDLYAQAKACGAVLIAHKKHRFADVLLPDNHPAHTPSLSPDVMTIQGSSGSAAVRWAKAIGATNIRMVGFGGVGHFYDGGKPNPDRPWPYAAFERETKLAYQVGGVPDNNPAAWIVDDNWSREDVRRYLRNVYLPYPERVRVGGALDSNPR